MWGTLCAQRRALRLRFFGFTVSLREIAAA
jgi:hypothetical protein